MGVRQLLVIGTLTVGLLFGSLLQADEAVSLDGRRLPGKLVWGANGRLTFVIEGRVVPLSELHRIRFPATPSAFRADTVRRVVLPGDQWLTGDWLGLGDRALLLRTAWAEKLTVPRSAVVALLSPPLDGGRLPDDAGQDGVWLRSGDQIFGTIAGADRRRIDLHGRFGERSLAWEDVRGICFRRPAPPPRTTEGEHVRVGIRSHVDADDDILEGTVQALDDHRLVLRHSTLSTITIDRSRLAWLSWRFSGRRLELDNGFHHLGRESVGGLGARPEGLSLRRTFTLVGQPEGARLMIEMIYLQGPGADAATAAALRRGGLRTEVLVNGQVLDYLNRHVERAVRQPSRLRLDLPRLFLRAGANEVELRQTPDPETGRYGNCGLTALAIEIPQ